MPRYFVAVWPPPEVLDVVATLPRAPDLPIRWTSRDQWHVTLSFLGDVDERSAVLALESIEAAAAVATFGLTTEALGDQVQMIPVNGLGTLAEAVRIATRNLSGRSMPKPFVGHLTLGRLRQPSSPVAAIPVPPTEFAATEIALVRSHLGSDGASYTSVTRRSLVA